MTDLFGLSSENRAKQATLLQASLVDLIALSLLLKQAHWNLVGSGFIAVHEQLDSVLDEVREIADEIAERMVTLGHAPDGRAATVASSSTLTALPSTTITIGAAIKGIAGALSTLIVGLRQRIEACSNLDPVTEDLFITSTAALEKHHWMLRAHLESPAHHAGMD